MNTKRNKTLTALILAAGLALSCSGARISRNTITRKPAQTAKA